MLYGYRYWVISSKKEMKKDIRINFTLEYIIRIYIIYRVFPNSKNFIIQKFYNIKIFISYNKKDHRLKCTHLQFNIYIKVINPSPCTSLPFFFFFSETRNSSSFSFNCP